MKSYLKLYYLAYFILPFGFTACNNDSDNPEPFDDEGAIQAFLTVNNIAATKSDEWDVYYIELEAGTGDEVELNSIVDIDYELSLANENNTALFSDSNYAFVPEVRSIMEGVARGALTMKEGGKSYFVIPSAYAYGPSSGELPNGAFVPANAIIQANITVNEIRTAGEQQVWEEIRIEEYLAQEQLDSNAFFLTEGVFKAVITEGDIDSSNPIEGNNVTISYQGSLLDGTIFDESSNAQFNLTPGSLIDGFYNSVLSMKRNEEAIFVMTSDQAYGDAGTSGIAPFSSLIFRIRLIDY